MSGCAHARVWPCVDLLLPSPPPLSSTGTASFQAHVFFDLTYHNSCLLLPWLLVFLLPFILQCIARVILLGFI